MNTLRSRMQSRSRGVAAIEFALILPVMLLLAFGITEGGRAIYQYNTLVKATRDAARYLSMYPPGSTTQQIAAKCLAVYGNVGCAGNRLTPGLDVSNIAVTESANVPAQGNGTTPTGVMNLVTVTISGYRFQWLGPYNFWDVTFGPVFTAMRQVT